MPTNFETFGKYILLEKIQTGGMAEIYLARRPGASGVSKFLAIKRILPQFSEQVEFIEMFKDEAKIAVNLSHANIVGIHEFGMEKNQLFLAMDYVEGRNLRQILNKMKKSGVSFSIEQVIYIIKEVAGGLDHAHRSIDANSGKPLNIIHRDMSPQNIMVSFEGEVKVVDFGIAKAETQLDNTRAGTLKGKFGYMSPEQAEGQAVDLRTDIFALGIVLWELLANDRLFVANNEINTLRKVRDCQIPSLRKINPNIAAELERIVSKSLAKDRNLRYQTSAAFHRELSRFLNRQFPDFSAQDFSVFIKTLFAAEILDSRKKMIEYSKAEVALPPAVPALTSDFQETSAFTTSGTHTEATEGEPFDAHPSTPQAPEHKSTSRQGQSQSQARSPSQSQNQGQSQNQNPRAPTATNGRPVAPSTSAAVKNVNTGNLSVDRNGLGAYSNSGASYNGTRSFSNITIKSSGFRWSSLVPIVLIVFGLAVGVLAFAPGNPRDIPAVKQILAFLQFQKPEVAPEPVPDVNRALASVMYNVSVTSEPSGAVIEVDGKPLDSTPASFKWQQHDAKKIVIHMQGYLPQEREIKVESNMAIEFKLLAEKMGRIEVNVIGQGEIFIDGKKVADAGPYIATLKAGVEHTIKAIDPVTHVEDEWRGMIGDREAKRISLLPGKIIKRQGASVKK